MKKNRLTKAGFACAMLGLAVCALSLLHFPASSEAGAEFPFKANDRVEWVGSSSTRIGTWCRMLEFMLRTRHPELKLTFNRGTTGGGTFLTGIKNLPVWLNDFKPTYVLFNYGGNDAGAGVKGIPSFKLNMQKCAELARESGARVGFTTHQSGDIRVTAPLPFESRRLYAEEMLKLAREKEWPIYDAHHPLESYQLAEQKEIADFTINRDRIHLTDGAYVAWGLFVYERMNPPEVESSAEVNADGSIGTQRGCKISEVTHNAGVLEFVREDSVLPLLPPNPVPLGNPLKTVVPSAGSAIGSALKDATREYIKPAMKSDPLKSLTGAPISVSTAPVVDAVPPKTAAAAPAVSLLPAPSSGPVTQSVTSASNTAGAIALTAVQSSATAPQVKPAGPPPFKIPPAQVLYAAHHGQELPPRKLVPLEKYSRYMLKVSGLSAGNYQVSCDGSPIGSASAKELAEGVNLNSMLLDSKNPAPWRDLVKNLWIGQRLEEIGNTKFRYKIEKQ